VGRILIILNKASIIVFEINHHKINYFNESPHDFPVR